MSHPHPFSLDGADLPRSQPYGLGSSMPLFASTSHQGAFDSGLAPLSLSAQTSGVGGGGPGDRDPHSSSSSFIGLGDEADFASALHPPPDHLRLRSHSGAPADSSLAGGHSSSSMLSMLNSPHMAAQPAPGSPSLMSSMAHSHTRMPSLQLMHSSGSMHANMLPPAVSIPAPNTMQSSAAAAPVLSDPLPPVAVPSDMDAVAAAAMDLASQSALSQFALAWMMAQNPAVASFMAAAAAAMPNPQINTPAEAAAAASSAAATAESGSSLSYTETAATAAASSAAAASSSSAAVLPASAAAAASAASSAAVPSVPSELDSMRQYQHHQSQLLSFLKHFRELPASLRVEAFKHPPPYVDAHTILTALLSLSITAQVELINQLPRPLQASLVKSLTKKERNRLVDALTKKSTAEIAREHGGVQPYFDEDTADEFCAPPPSQYRERAAAIAAEESQGRHHRHHGTGKNDHLKPTFSVTMRGAAVPTCLDRSRNPRTHFLPVIQQMMLSFGDVHYVDCATHTARSDPVSGTMSWPSLYTAMRVQEAVEEFVACFLPQIKPGRAGLDRMIRIFPQQARCYFKWKEMNSRAKTQQQQAAQELDSDAASEMSSASDEEDDESPAKSLRKVPKRKRKTGKPPKGTEGAAAAPPSKRGRKRGGSAASTSAAASSTDVDSEAPTRGRGRGRGGRGRGSAATRGRGAKRAISSRMSDSDGESSEHSDSGASGSEESESCGAAADDEEAAPDAEAAEAAEGEADPELAEVEEILGTTAAAERPAAAEGEERKECAPAAASASAATAAAHPDAPPVSTAYDIFFPSLDLHLGPFHRLSHQTALSVPMSDANYFQFVHCREASFVPSGRMQPLCRWLHVPSALHKSALQFLAYLCWDRVGMIVELCASLRENSRHARSNLPFTVYEANTAVRMLDAHPLTALEHIRRTPDSEAMRKQLLLSYFESTGMTSMPAAVNMPQWAPLSKARTTPPKPTGIAPKLPPVGPPPSLPAAAPM